MALDVVREAVELTLWTGGLANEQPGSMLVAAEEEEGKTYLVSPYKNLGSVGFLSDATAHGMVRAYQQKLRAGQTRHFIFPELLRPLERNKETAASFVAFLSELVEEGVKEIQTFPTSFRLTEPIQAGVLACIARGGLSYRLHHWNVTGFLSRFLVVSYTYGPNTAKAVMDSILNGTPPAPINLVLPTMPLQRQTVQVPHHLAQDIADIAAPLASAIYAPLHGYRMTKHLMRLAMASALRDGRSIVTSTDLVPITNLVPYINLNYASL
jgi:hypothetical protein